MGRNQQIGLLTALLVAAGGVACTQDSGVKVYNTAPSISITSPSPGSAFFEDEVLTLEAFAQDDTTPAEILLVDWSSDLDGKISEDMYPDAGGAVVFHTANLTPGNHVITVQVVDMNAASGSDYVSLTIEDVPDAPTLSIVHPVPGEYGVEDEAYTFVAMVSDAQDTPNLMTLRVSSDVDGLACAEAPDATGVASCDGILSPGEHFVTFQVEDTDGEIGDATVYFEVKDADEVDNDGDGQTEDEGDCDDTDPSVHDGATEHQNGVDDDCDDEIDEGTDAYDDDGDCACEDLPCFGSIEPACGPLEGGDCDDTNATVYPLASELCDSIDNDCDGQVDEDDSADAGTWYVDLDQDGYGNLSASHDSCVAPFGYVSDNTDCDDSRASVSPSGSEVCNGLDDDCDGSVDDGVQATWWRDLDGDGHGDAVRPQLACAQPSGYSSVDDDCDDYDASVSPSATEYCNSIDDNCDGVVDENTAADAVTWYGDNDGDGYGYLLGTVVACSAPTGYLANASDCDDTNSAIHPAAVEMCDGFDNNCDGVADESTAADASTWYADVDGDGFGDPGNTQLSCWQNAGYLLNASDCNDGNNAVHPGATETCNNVDDDCDGVVDDGVGSTWYRDADGDGYGTPTNSQSACTQPGGFVANNGDCNDGDASLNPHTVWYLDQDADGQGTSTTILVQCAQPGGYVSNYQDCNDFTAAAYQGATETCDSIDNDCDTLVDEQNASGCTTYYYDYDNDGFGSTSTACYCAPTDYYRSSQGGDCYDYNANAHPGQTYYWLSHRGDGSWDYDCDGSSTQGYYWTGGCGGWPSCSTYGGWNSGVPACGNSGSWVNSCSLNWNGCRKSTRTEYQYCR